MRTILLSASLPLLLLMVLLGAHAPSRQLLTDSLGIEAAQAARRPVALLQRSEWDFGVVKAGPALRATFPMTNAGSRRLIVREKAQSCDCVSATRPENIIESGQTVELEAVLQTADLRGGKQLELQYRTNDPDLPTFSLTLLAEVRPPIAGHDEEP